MKENADRYGEGWDFERCTERMFPENDFEILFRSDEKVGKVPDFYIRDIHGRIKFWVEAKWRGRVGDKVNIFEDKQDKLNTLLIFQGFVWPERVFMISGLGGRPSSPNEVFCIPVQEIEYASPYRTRLDNFKRTSDCGLTFNPYEKGCLSWRAV